MPGRKTPIKTSPEETPTEKSAGIKLRLKRTSDSSSTGDSPSVGPPAEKIRLTTTGPSDDQNHSPNGIRPRRHAGKPKRYSEDSTAPTVDSVHKDSPPIKLRLSFSPKNSAPASPLLDENGGLIPGGYDAAFLDHYIETYCVGNGVSPMTPVAAPKSSPRQVASQGPPSAIPFPANPYAPPAAEHYRPLQQEDVELIMLQKLTRATNILLTTPDHTKSSGRSHSNLGAPVQKASKAGRVDADIRDSIKILIGILGWFAESKMNLLNSATPKVAGHHIDRKTLSVQIDAVHQAVTSLEEIHDSAVLNINRIIPGDRLRLLMEFYDTLHALTHRLVYLQASPSEIPVPLLDIMLFSPEPAIQGSNHAGKKPRTSYSKDTLEAAAADAAAHQRNGGQGPPPPHQFLRKELDATMPPPRVPASKLKAARGTR